MTRQVFFSFHYNADAWRTAQIRNIGVVEGERIIFDNDWEEVKKRETMPFKTGLIVN
jgi:hypothetical protein